MEYSNLGKNSRRAFSIGLLLYVVPADIVYVLYGMKSILALSILLSETVDNFFIVLGSLLCLTILIVSYHAFYRRKILLSLHKIFMFKFALMVAVWIVGLGIVGITNSPTLSIVLAGLFFFISLIIAEFFPEKVFRIPLDIYDLSDLLPRHKVSSYLTIIKISLVLLIPFIGFILIHRMAGYVGSIPIYPINLTSLIYSITIIIFMYVGSGIYNILVYKWVANNLSRGRRAILIATMLSILTYVTFTVLIISAVSSSILISSDINREHAFISLSRQLTCIGLTLMGYITIVAANIFALISVSVAYTGFTDTLSERINLDTKMDFDLAWLITTIAITTITILLEIYNVERFATDALGIAGNAGGGIFILVLPWLLSNEKGVKRIRIAMLFLAIITVLNIFLMLDSSTIIAKIIAIIATILALVVSLLAILEAKKEI